jgi:hypothetical protein
MMRCFSNIGINFFNRLDVLWVQLIWECWRDLLHLLDTYKGMAPVVIQDGRTCNFWEDVWNSQAPKLNFPVLFSYAKKRYSHLSES